MDDLLGAVFAMLRCWDMFRSSFAPCTGVRRKPLSKTVLWRRFAKSCFAAVRRTPAKSLKIARWFPSSYLLASVLCVVL